MSATDELRAMLDERGVEWRGGLPTETIVDDPIGLLYVQRADGMIHAYIRTYFTPEQAVEATLGRGTCHIDGGECDQCGAWVREKPVTYWVPTGEGIRTAERHDALFCPACGRRVMEVTDHDRD